MPTRLRMPIAEYLALPEEKPYLEYIDGEVVPKVAPDLRHMVIAHEFAMRLDEHRRLHGGIVGPEGRVELDLVERTDFRLPDVAYWARGRRIRGERALAPPTLAIEIRSPGQDLRALREKCRALRRAGVEVCWLVDPDARTVEVFEEGTQDGTLLGEEATLISPHLRGFAMRVADAFATLDGLTGDTAP